MQVGKIESSMKIPDKRPQGFATKYPVADLKVGEGFIIKPEKGDEAVSLKDLKKRIVASIRQVERRMGKTTDDKKIKDFAVWIDEKKGGVYIALREDNSKSVKATAKAATKAVTQKDVDVPASTPKAEPKPVAKKAASKTTAKTDTAKVDSTPSKPEPLPPAKPAPAPSRVPPKPLNYKAN